jgi:hypothetical protein
MRQPAILLTLFCSLAFIQPGHAASAAPSDGHPPIAEKAMEKKPDTAVPEEKGSISGKVVEAIDSPPYTYTYLEKGATKTWVACPTIKVMVGQELTFVNCIEMRDFKSKNLARNF